MICNCAIAVIAEYAVSRVCDPGFTQTVKKLLVCLSLPMLVASAVNVVKRQKLIAIFAATCARLSIQRKNIFAQADQALFAPKRLGGTQSAPFAPEFTLLLSRANLAVKRETILGTPKAGEIGFWQCAFASVTVFHGCILAYAAK